MELTDTNKPCGLTISFLKKVIFTLLFNSQWTSFLSLAFPSGATTDLQRKEVTGTKNTRFFGGHSEEDPPVPIPNTEVKLLSADGTAWETVWESRSLPILFPYIPDQSILVGDFFLNTPTPFCSWPRFVRSRQHKAFTTFVTGLCFGITKQKTLLQTSWFL